MNISQIERKKLKKLKVKIGLTGNIGSGKTTVAKKFEQLGIPVFYADDEAKKLYQEPEVILQVKKAFGDKVFTNDIIDFKKLANVIFTDKVTFSDNYELKKINSIIHPIVMEKYRSWHKKQNTDYTILESAIIFECLIDHFDFIVTVCAPKPLRIERVMKRDNISRIDVLKRMLNQIEEETKKDFSVAIIENDGEKDLDKEVEGVDKWLKLLFWRNCTNCEFVRTDVFTDICENKKSSNYLNRVDGWTDCKFWKNNILERKHKLTRIKNTKNDT